MARPHKKNPIKKFGAVTSITMLRPGLMHTRARSMAVSAASIHDTLKVGPACCWLRKGGRRGAVTGGALTFLPHETAGARRHARAAGVVSAGAPEAEKMDCARRPDEQRCAGAAARGALACARGGARTTANAAHCERRTGKTFHALRSVAAGETGAYCGPLRLLAWEVHEKLNEGKITGRPVACDLITGQERVLVPNARHRSSTIGAYALCVPVHFHQHLPPRPLPLPCAGVVTLCRRRTQQQQQRKRSRKQGMTLCNAYIHT